jgi:hypothetical protein
MRGFTAAAMLIGVTLLANPARALDEVSFESLTDMNRVKLGEQVQYLVVIHFGSETMTPTITPPSFDQFSVLKEFQTIQTQGEGREQYKVLKKIWRLSPNESGHLSIAAAIITYQDPTTLLLKTGKTKVQFVDVFMPESAGTSLPAVGADRVPAKSWTWWLGALAVAGLAVAGWLLLRGKPTQPATAGRSPEDAGLAALDRTLSHLEEENLQAYYADLTHVLLDYLQQKFAVDAQAWTTPVLLENLGQLGFTPDLVSGLERFLAITEKTKFAGYVPSEEEMLVLHNTVKNLIEAGRALRRRAGESRAV